MKKEEGARNRISLMKLPGDALLRITTAIIEESCHMENRHQRFHVDWFQQSLSKLRLSCRTMADKVRIVMSGASNAPMSPLCIADLKKKVQTMVIPPEVGHTFWKEASARIELHHIQNEPESDDDDDELAEYEAVSMLMADKDEDSVQFLHTESLSIKPALTSPEPLRPHVGG